VLSGDLTAQPPPHFRRGRLYQPTTCGRTPLRVLKANSSEGYNGTSRGMRPDIAGPQGENGAGSGTGTHDLYGSRPPPDQWDEPNAEGDPNFVERDRQ